jgi:hypothetical protein
MNAPPLLVLVMQVSNNPTTVKDRVNGRMVTILGWTTTVLIFLAAIDRRLQGGTNV